MERLMNVDAAKLTQWTDTEKAGHSGAICVRVYKCAPTEIALQIRTSDGYAHTTLTGKEVLLLVEHLMHVAARLRTL